MKSLIVLVFVLMLAGCSGSDSDGTAGGSGEKLTDQQVQQNAEQHDLTPEESAQLEESLEGLEHVTQEDLDEILKEIK